MEMNKEYGMYNVIDSRVEKNMLPDWFDSELSIYTAAVQYMQQSRNVVFANAAD